MKRFILFNPTLIVLTLLGGMYLPACGASNSKDEADVNLNRLEWPECIPAPPGANEGGDCGFPNYGGDCYLATTPAWDRGDICMTGQMDRGTVLTNDNVQRYIERRSSRPMIILPCCDANAVIYARQSGEIRYSSTVYDTETRRVLGYVEFAPAEAEISETGELVERSCFATYHGDPAFMPCAFNALREAESRDEVCEDQGCECVVNGLTDAVPDDCE